MNDVANVVLIWHFNFFERAKKRKAWRWPCWL